MNKNIKENKAITLVALVITIIILLILSGISIYVLTGSSLFEKAKLAEQKAKNEQNKEEKTLGGYENKISEYVGNNREIISSLQPTGIKTDIYIKNVITNSSAYNVTTMNGLPEEKDSENKINEYLSYSKENGYTVLKSGWYFIKLATEINSSSSADVSIYFIINENILTSCLGWSNTSIIDRNINSFPIYLEKDDKIYFMSIGNNSAKTRHAEATCYPMF